MILSFFSLKNTSRPLYEIEFSLRSFSVFITSSGWANSYLLEDVPFPAELPPEIGDLAFDQNGKLYACLRRGDVVVSQPGKDLSKIEWQVFATGLHNGMGMEVTCSWKNCGKPDGRTYSDRGSGWRWCGRPIPQLMLRFWTEWKLS